MRFTVPKQVFPAIFLIVVSAVVTVSMTAFLVQAAESIETLSDAEKKALEDKQDQLDAIKAKIKAYKDIVALKQRQGAALSDQVEALEAQTKSLELEIQTNEQALRELNTDIANLSGRIEQKEAVITSQKNLLASILRESYATQSDLPLDIMVNATRYAEPLQMDEWTYATGQKIRELLGSLRTLRTSLIEERKKITDKKIQADALRLELEERQQSLEEARAEKERLRVKAESEAKKYDALVDDLEEQRKEIENEIEDIESAKTAALDLKDVPGYKKGLLSYPVEDVKISQRYGKTSFTRWYTFHNGTDFQVDTGSKVLAAADGKVVAIGNNGRYAYGRWMAIDHGNGLVTMYGHLSAYGKKVGDKVKQGDTIAKSGNTGYSTGPHLHFTVFSTKSFDIVPSKKIKSVRDIPVGATINPNSYLP